MFAGVTTGVGKHWLSDSLGHSGLLFMNCIVEQEEG